MLVTSNTLAPIVDGLGQPVVNGKVFVNDTDTFGNTVNLYRSIYIHDNSPENIATNPIQLNSAGAFPYPVYCAEKMVWCFVQDENGENILSYPVLSAGSASSGNDDTSEILADVIRVKTLFADLIESLKVNKDAQILGNLEVRKFLKVYENAKISGWLQIDENNTTIGNGGITTPKLSVRNELELEEDAKINIAGGKSIPIFDLNANHEFDSMAWYWTKIEEQFPPGAYLTAMTTGGTSYNIGRTMYVYEFDKSYKSNKYDVFKLSDDPFIHEDGLDLNPQLVVRIVGLTGNEDGANATIDHRFYLCQVLRHEWR